MRFGQNNRMMAPSASAKSLGNSNWRADNLNLGISCDLATVVGAPSEDAAIQSSNKTMVPPTPNLSDPDVGNVPDKHGSKNTLV